jgi:hypothetical protein
MKGRPFLGFPTAKEKDVEHACDRLMMLMGWRIVRFSQARATMQTPGIPDRKYYAPDEYRGAFIASVPLTFWFECKREGGKQSDYQKRFQKMCEAAGEHYVLGGVDELTAWLSSKGLIEETFKGTWKPITYPTAKKLGILSNGERHA